MFVIDILRSKDTLVSNFGVLLMNKVEWVSEALRAFYLLRGWSGDRFSFIRY